MSNRSAIVVGADPSWARTGVVGRRRHGRLASMLLGSTARAVLQHAPCPMAIVHERNS